MTSETWPSSDRGLPSVDAPPLGGPTAPSAAPPLGTPVAPAPTDGVPPDAPPDGARPGAVAASRPPRPASAGGGWWRRFTRRSSLSAWVNAVAIVGVTAVAFWQLHPELLLANTTAAGGDTGAHVALPAFLESGLLGHGQLTGWDPGWYDGFPLYTFYFPLPGLLVVLLNVVLPYNIAFKLVTALGTLTLPLAAWAFGRLAGLRDPGPGCLAAATLPFLFEPSFTIYGGNILSTMAGEFSYSLGLSLALVFLGLMAYVLRTGRHRATAAVLLAVTLLCHLITFLFAVVGMGVWLLLDADLARSVLSGVRGRVARRRWSRRLVATVVVGALGVGLAFWWLLPFVVRDPYTTNMGWQNVEGFPHLLFPASARWVLVLAAIGAVATVLRRNRVGWFVGVVGGISAAAVCLDPQGKLYNVRVLPFWFLCLYLMGGIAVAEVVAAAARWERRHRLRRWSLAVAERLAAGAGTAAGWRPGMRITRFRRPVPGPEAPGALVGPLVALAGACLAVIPGFALSAGVLGDIGITPGGNQPAAWAAWNYSGYQRKPDYPEYRAVVSMMAKVGAEDGCGQSMWEYSPDLNRFGTPESLMLLPYWTNGCIGSMEGLLFESATTTPYHFLDQSELSAVPSDAMNGLPYVGLNIPLGVEHLQELGVRYFLASSATVESRADADPELTEVGSTGPWRTTYNGLPEDTTWKVYRVADSGTVQPLADRPVVWQGVGASQTSWLNPSVDWFDDPTRWGVVPAADGPPSWTLVAIGDSAPPAVAEPATTVSDVHQTDDTVSFHVSRVGTPVEVKVSYFPNWQATGADGPWRVAPNLMVVVPTSHDVVLHYGSTPVDRIGKLVSLISLAVVVGMAVVGHRRRRSRAARRGAPSFTDR